LHLTAIPVKELLEQEIDLGAELQCLYYIRASNQDKPTTLDPKARFLKNMLLDKSEKCPSEKYNKAA
jgi:hypothetical protein